MYSYIYIYNLYLNYVFKNIISFLLFLQVFSFLILCLPTIFFKSFLFLSFLKKTNTKHIQTQNNKNTQNGNLTNGPELAKFLREKAFRHVNTTSDSELLLNVLAHELQNAIMEGGGNLESFGSDDIFAAVEVCNLL